jgi:hypothetical protein
MRHVLSWTLGSLLVLQASTRAQQAEDTRLPVSTERIRAALQQPLAVTSATSGELPMFRVEVREQQLLRPPDPEPPFDPTYGLPTIGELVIGGIGKILNSVVKYNRARAERRAKKEVEEALAAFCAARHCPAPTAGR